MQRDVNVEVIEERVGDDLPRGWAWARLGSLVCLAQNGLSKRRSNEGVPSIVLRLADIRDGTISLENVRRIDLTNSELEHYKLATNDVLCIRVNGSRNIVGRMIPCASVSKPVAFCDHFIRFGFTHGVILPVYLAKYFDTDTVRRYIDLNAVSSAGQNTVSQGMIGHIPIPLPPFSEQHRIVAEIEKQFSRLDAAVVGLKQVQAKLKRYRAAVLKAAVEGTLTEAWRAEHPDVEPASVLLQRILQARRSAWEQAELAKFAKASRTPPKGWQAKYQEPTTPNTSNLPDLPKGWCYAFLAPLLSTSRQGVKTGPFGSLLKKQEHQPEGIPVLGIENIEPMRFVPGTRIHITENKASQLSDYDAQSGDILISRSGTVGEVCVVPYGMGPARISTNVMRVSLTPNGMLPEFFSMLFNGSPLVLGQISDMCKGSTREFLNQHIMSSIVFPLPPLIEQEQIVAEVERRLSVVAETEAQVEADLKRAERLRQSILKQAFAGKLVPQDPEDEPASVLLERLRSQRRVGADTGQPEKAVQLRLV